MINFQVFRISKFAGGRGSGQEAQRRRVNYIEKSVVFFHVTFRFKIQNF